jgi:porin
MSTNDRNGRHTGSYDVEIAADLEKLWGMEGLGLFIHGEGGWPDMEGIDGDAVGSISGVNGDAGGNRSLDVVEVIFEWDLLDGALALMLGKMDFAGVFDASEYANDETGQFLNGALVNNLTVPLPDYCLGAILTANLSDAWYLSVGAGDAQADGRETGFRTAFHREDYFFYAAETGYSPEFDSGKGPMPGTYRIGLWNDPQAKERFSDGAIHRDDTGLYISCDQMIYKENKGPEDSQGLGVFTRYGLADKKVNDITDFWSVGLQYQGVFEDRNDDVLGVGYAKGILSTEAGYADVYESVFEVYYNAQITPWMSISPNIQVIDNPGGDNAVQDAIVAGVRAQSAF